MWVLKWPLEGKVLFEAEILITELQRWAHSICNKISDRNCLLTKEYFAILILKNIENSVAISLAVVVSVHFASSLRDHYILITGWIVKNYTCFVIYNKFSFKWNYSHCFSTNFPEVISQRKYVCQAHISVHFASSLRDHFILIAGWIVINYTCFVIYNQFSYKWKYFHCSSTNISDVISQRKCVCQAYISVRFISSLRDHYTLITGWIVKNYKCFLIYNKFSFEWNYSHWSSTNISIVISQWKCACQARFMCFASLLRNHYILISW